ncbi:MAG TPA: FHA domain-containing protein [Gemmataceae bacterium]|jgi:predicted component of type VI protein secretion system|nr:FHA domain-containing protein [Gemmataceae bacterium]
MKLSLVVAQGVHSGKVIPVTAAEFLIGRDPECQLRPASPAISKQHCALSTRGDKVFVRDCGSTNGTFINDEQVAGERQVKSGDKLKVGPLEFELRIDVSAPTPAPAAKPVAKPAPALAAKPAPKPVAKPAAKPVPVAAGDAVPSGATVVLEPGALAKMGNATTVVDSAPKTLNEDPDHLAAMLLGLDEPGGSAPTVEQISADPTTVMEMPALGAKAAETKKDEPKKTSGTDSSSAAAEVLSKYMRRPRT